MFPSAANDILSVIMLLSLAMILSVISIIDYRTHRIPNVILLPLLLFGLVYYAVIGQWVGLLFSIKGMGVGFIVLFIPYIMGGIGAGDVKLMCALGAILGPQQIFTAFLFTGILGGLVALAIMIRKGTVALSLKRLGAASFLFISGAGFSAFEDNTRRQSEGIPYGPIIAAGALSSVIWQLAVQGTFQFVAH